MMGSNLTIMFGRGLSQVRLSASSSGAFILVGQCEVHLDREELLDLAAAARALADRSP